jgi:hypothetical protein
MRTPEPLTGQKARIQRLGLRLADIGVHHQASCPQTLCPPARNPWVGILAGNHHAPNPRFDQRIGARRRAPGMTARLKRDKGMGPNQCLCAEPRARLIQRDGFRMGPASRLGPAAPENLTSALRRRYDDTAHRRVRPDIAQPALRQSQRGLHEIAITVHGWAGSGESRRRSIVFDEFAILGQPLGSDEVLEIANLPEILIDRCEAHIGNRIQIGQRIHDSFADGIGEDIGLT